MSLLHIVLFSLHEGVQAKDPRVTDAAQLSAEHPRHIPEIREWWSGFDVSGRDIAADFMVMGLSRKWSAGEGVSDRGSRVVSLR